MKWIVRRATNVMVGAFVGSGVGIDDRGRLCLPDGLTPERVHRFIDLCMQEQHASPRAALHGLFRRLGLSRGVVQRLEQILDERGNLDLGAVARHAPSLLSGLHDFKQVPERFRTFLVLDLELAEPACESLEEAVVSTRETAAARIGCAPGWDAILEHTEAVSELARPWRERLATA